MQGMWDRAPGISVRRMRVGQAKRPLGDVFWPILLDYAKPCRRLLYGNKKTGPSLISTKLLGLILVLPSALQ